MERRRVSGVVVVLVGYGCVEKKVGKFEAFSFFEHGWVADWISS